MGIKKIIPRFKIHKRVRPTPGSPPGTLAAREDLPAPILHRFSYSVDRCDEQPTSPAEVERLMAERSDEMTWIDIQGLGDADTITTITRGLGLHPLTLEDIVHVHQRPKIEQFNEYLFIVLRVVRLAESGHIDTEQLSLVLKDGMLITFQERPGDGFEPVRKRLREGKGALRRSSTDYLAYALIDTVIDNYFPVLERYGEVMDQLDDEVLENPTRQTSNGIHATKRELRAFRRAVWPLREVVGSLGREEIAQISDTIRPAFRDCHDHAVQIADFVESNRERASDLVDFYLAAVSDKTNQVMKVLTIIATIFIPLTFLAGLYGMNFDPEASPYNMPELKWRYGYPAFWGALTVVFLGMLWFFRRKGWIGGQDSSNTSAPGRGETPGD